MKKCLIILNIFLLLSFGCYPYTEISNLPSNLIEGSGTTNVIPKFSTNTTLQDSSITDNGTWISTSENITAGRVQVTSANITGDLYISGNTTMPNTGYMVSPKINENVALSANSTYLNYVDDNNFIDQLVSRENYHPLILMGDNIESSTTVGSGTGDAMGTVYGIMSGTTPNSSKISCYVLSLYSPTPDGLYRFNWDKDFTLTYIVRVSTSNTEATGYIQIKGATTLGAAGTYAIGLKMANMTLYGESYGSGGLATLDLSSALSDGVASEIKIVYTAGSSIKWYVNGVLKGTQTNVNNIPSGNSASSTYFTISAQNGATAAGYTYYTGLVRLGVSK